MTRQHKVIASKSDGNMMDSWTVYLLLTQSKDNGFEIGGAQYEILGLVEDYFGNDGELILPDEIHGKRVHSAEGGYIVGGELNIDFSQYSVLRFKEFARDEVESWLLSEGWDQKLSTEIEKSIRKMK